MKFNKTFKITATALGMLIPLLFLSTFVQSSNLNTPENQEQEEGKSNKAMKLIVIDPGHGGNLPGAKGEFTYEKDIVLQVGKKIKRGY